MKSHHFNRPGSRHHFVQLELQWVVMSGWRLFAVKIPYLYEGVNNNRRNARLNLGLVKDSMDCLTGSECRRAIHIRSSRLFRTRTLPRALVKVL